MARERDRMIAERGKPAMIVSDNGTEFTSNAMLRWSSAARIAWHFIAPGEPTRNAFIESFNGKLCDECLNENVFLTLHEVRTIVEAWRGAALDQGLRAPPRCTTERVLETRTDSTIGRRPIGEQVIPFSASCARAVV